ncbi:hydrolase TatD [Alginatibacterium sediminis]|uniref:Hydrolase TatD n=1 Tax=Alginatibacterium sediminis TaxID=2164068 RepID=A0A420E6P0_9ALTE|nr:TatD family hydrolase [Alginatibacterium sediminis]RKF13301.1 hydrolase TatD [Alginatibacterium sediminis]
MFDLALNLSSSQFDKDRDEMMQRGFDAGVAGVLALSSELEESKSLPTLVANWPQRCWASVGVHPHHAKSCSIEQLQQLLGLSAADNVIAIGECGLDFNRDFSPRDQQEQIFEAQLKIAAELKMPVVMHERDAFERFYPILKAWRPHLVGAVLHCFTGSESSLKAYLDLDIYIGVTGWLCDERRGQDLQAMLPLIPNERLFLETDAPYLLPRDLKPKPKSRRNELMYLGQIYSTAARLRQQELSQLKAMTQANAERLFGIRL